MDDYTGTPSGTGSTEDGTAGTSDSSNNPEEANAELLGDEESTITDEAGSVVFGEQKTSSMFNSLEDAEKSYKEKQRYEEELKKKLAQKEVEIEELQRNQVGRPNDDTEALRREIAAIKAEQTINSAFSQYKEKHPEFGASIQAQAKDVIDTYIRAGKSIKLDDAVAIAKAQLGLVGDQDPAETHKVIQSAALGGGRPGTVPNTRNEKVDPKQQAMLDKFNDPKYYTPGLRKLLKQK